jgi:hypothetical protein
MAAEKGVEEACEWLRTGQPPQKPEWVKAPHVDPRLESEDEGTECLENPREILREVVALRDHLIREMQGASSSSHPVGLPHGVLRAPDTPEEGLALLQGKVDPEFTLPPLECYFEDMEQAELENIPPWYGEPKNDSEFMETIDAIIACCRQAVDQGDS